jgi:hypothetical protein
VNVSCTRSAAPSAASPDKAPSATYAGRRGAGAATVYEGSGCSICAKAKGSRVGLLDQTRL